VTVVVLECVNMYLLTYLLTHWSEENGNAVVILPVLFGADFGTTPYFDRQLVLNYSSLELDFCCTARVTIGLYVSAIFAVDFT